MIKSVFLFITSICLSFTLLGQSSQISESGGVIMLIDLEKSNTANFERGSYNGKPHVLGDTITFLLDKVESTYVYYKESTGAYSSMEKNIEKPIIYSSLQKVIKYYDKLLRKDKIESQKAKEDLLLILNNGIALKNFKTETFELNLKATRNKAELARLFEKVRFQN